MEISKIKSRVRCDIGLCKKDAVYVIGGQSVMSNRKVYICEDCMKEIYEQFSSIITPKSPENLIKKAMKKAKQD